MIKFLKNSKFIVKDPERLVGQDAGFDFYVPEFNEEFKNVFLKDNPPNVDSGVRLKHNHNQDGKEDNYLIVVDPGHSVIIDSGIKTRFNSDIILEVNNKSGVAKNKRIIAGAQIVDSSYEGWIKLVLINVSYATEEIPLGFKIIQLVPKKIDLSEFTVESDDKISSDEFYKCHNSSRGEGRFGSTGN